jgi:chromosome segregation ATPase
MLLLNIFQNIDGSFAWETLVILFAGIIAGYLLSRFTAKKTENKLYSKGISEWENKYKHLESEFKNYKSNISSSEKHAEKSAQELSGRVKALEGDIRALSEEKNKFHHQLHAKEEENKNFSKQIYDTEDRLKMLKEAQAKSEAEWTEKLKVAKADLAKAMAWESRVRSAEEEAQKAKSIVGQAERKKLEAELRLKATTEYAGKVGPLETELQLQKEKFSALESEAKNKLEAFREVSARVQGLEQQLKGKEEELRSLGQKLATHVDVPAENKSTSPLLEEVNAKVNMLSAQLELQKENNNILQQEFEIKHATNVSLLSEIDNLKANLKKLMEDKESIKTTEI